MKRSLDPDKRGRHSTIGAGLDVGLGKDSRPSQAAEQALERARLVGGVPVGDPRRRRLEDMVKRIDTAEGDLRDKKRRLEALRFLLPIEKVGDRLQRFAEAARTDADLAAGLETFMDVVESRVDEISSRFTDASSTEEHEEVIRACYEYKRLDVDTVPIDVLEGVASRVTTLDAVARASVKEGLPSIKSVAPEEHAELFHAVLYFKLVEALGALRGAGVNERHKARLAADPEARARLLASLAGHRRWIEEGLARSRGLTGLADAARRLVVEYDRSRRESSGAGDFDLAAPAMATCLSWFLAKSERQAQDVSDLELLEGIVDEKRQIASRIPDLLPRLRQAVVWGEDALDDDALLAVYVDAWTRFMVERYGKTKKASAPSDLADLLYLDDRRVQTLAVELWEGTYKIAPDDDEECAQRVQDLLRFAPGERERMSDPEYAQTMGAGLFLARWAHWAFPRLVTSHTYASALMCTTVTSEVLEDLLVQWPAFEVHVPNGLLECGALDLDRIRVQISLGSSWFWLYARKRDDQGNLWVYCDTSSSLADLLSQPARSSDPFDRAAFLAKRLVAGLLLAMQHTVNFKERTVKGKHALGERRAAPDHRVCFIGAPIKVDTRDAVRRFVSDPRQRRTAPPSVQVVVRGHHKRQVIGVGRLGRKVIWVVPYWRGDEDAPILSRPKSLGR